MKIKKILLILLIFLIISILFIYLYINKIGHKPNLNYNNENEMENILYENEYSIKNKKLYLYKDEENLEDYRGMKLLEYKVLDEYSEIYYILYDYTTEPSFYYTVEITDDSGNSILQDGKKEDKIFGGTISTIRLEKIDLNSKINFSVFEKNEVTNQTVNSEKIQIDFANDLEEKIKIDQTSNLIDGFLGDIKFKYIDSEDVYFGTTSHAYSTDLVGENASIPIKVQYGNYLLPQEHIEISYERNVNSLSLEEAFESLSIINNNFGQYGLSDVYGMPIEDNEKNVIDTVIINFEDMINLCSGLSIEKDGKTYTKNSFAQYDNVLMVKDKNVKIGSKINAIKYYFDEDKDYDYYMFIYNENIYEIKTPTYERVHEDVQNFLDSLEIIE